MKKIRIQDGKFWIQKPGSEINILDPQHCLFK